MPSLHALRKKKDKGDHHIQSLYFFKGKRGCISQSLKKRQIKIGDCHNSLFKRGREVGMPSSQSIQERRVEIQVASQTLSEEGDGVRPSTTTAEGKVIVM